MHTDFFRWLEQHKGRQYDLHAGHVNPAFVKMLRTIGFDKGYVRGEGAYLWDEDGNKYLDLLTGWLHTVAEINPVTDVLEAVRQGFVGEVSWGDTWPGLVTLAGLAALFGAFALRGMRKMTD